MDTPTQEPQAAPFRPRHTAAQKFVLGLNIVLVFACVVGAVVLLYGKSQLDDRLQTAKVNVATTGLPVVSVTTDPGANSTTASTTPGTFPIADPGAKNFLITGADANSCVNPGSPWANAADPARTSIGNRSDTIMVMRVDPITRQAAVLSFPRDLWIQIPGKGKNRINSAYIKDDYSRLAATLYANFGITVDHYIQVDFCAFKRIVDAVDGVAVPFATPIKDANVGIDIKQAGCHTFGGDEALAYVRSRHLKWIDENGKAHEDRLSDFGRISRQQDFLRRVLQSALRKGITDPSIAQALIKSLQTEIVTESGFTVNDMMKFAGIMRDINPQAIAQYQVQASRLIVSGNDVLQVVDNENMRAILAIFQGKAPLAGAPVQVTDTTSVPTTVKNPTTSAATTTTVETTTTAVAPEEIVKGDILPDKNITC